MTFNTEQLDALKAPLSRSNVSERTQAGRKLSYIEGWHAESEANRIFGFDRWDTETVYERCVAEHQRKVGSQGADGWAVSYVCKVRVTVTTPGGDKIVREGVGAGHGIDRDLGLAHESALKESATDAEKRALKTFGNPFGLALYDKTQAQVSDGPSAANEAPEGTRLSAYEATRQGIGEAIKATIDKATARELDTWEKNFDRNTAHLPLGWLPSIRERIEQRRTELADPVAAGAEAGEAKLDREYRQTVGT